MAAWRVVILGGGMGGRAAARVFEDATAEDAARVDVVLVERAASYALGATYPFVLDGRMDVAAARDEVSASRLGLARVRLVCDEVVALETARKAVVLRAGGELVYDELIVALGVELAPETIPGLAAGAFCMASPEGAAAAHAAIAALHAPATVLLCAARLPHKCPPAPYEMAFIVASLLRERFGPLGESGCRVIVATPGDRAVPAFNPTVIEGLMAEAGIEFRPLATLESVDTTAKTAVFTSGEPLAFDVMIAMPPQAAPAVLRAALPCTPQGFVVTAADQSLRTPVPGVYCIGDAADIAVTFSGPAGRVATPKAGTFAALFGRTVASAVLAGVVARADGAAPSADEWTAPPRTMPAGVAGCLIETPGRQAMEIRFDLFGPREKPANVVVPPCADALADKCVWMSETRGAPVV